MGKIQKLDLFTSNRIAAGEVVEKPASVIKELVENSIDAGSSSIYIEIAGGGLDKIIVNDNGTGISPDDCMVAFDRHATSKIRNAGDLDDIATLGFRGEALSSIASVSRVELTTSTALDDIGSKIIVSGGEVESNERFACPTGTSIKVENLFYNTPARLKFLKKPALESAAVSDIVARNIIANPNVSIRFVQDKKEIYHSSGDGEIGNVMYCIYGKDVVNSLNKVGYEDDDLPISISGVVTTSSAAKPNRRYQSFIINGRYIQSQLLSNAVQQGFGTRLMGGKFPMCAIYVEVPFDYVDVNVHPNKLQVKFKDEKAIANAMISAIESSLSVQNILTFNFPKPEYDKKSIVTSTFGKLDTKPIDRVSNKQANNKAESLEESEEVLEDVSYDNIKAPKLAIDDTAIREITIPDFSYNNGLDGMLYMAEGNEEQLGLLELDDEESLSFNLVGQLFSTYIIVQKGEIAYIIDQHAAHEKMLFDKLKKSLDFSESQKLIVPYEISLEPVSLECLKQEMDLINSMGFEIVFLDGLLEIHAVPGFFSESEAAGFLEKLADYIEKLPYKKGVTNLTNDKIALMACKSAIKGNENLSDDEMKALVKRFEDVGELNCPHGRPIILKITEKDLEKNFKRIV